MVQALFVPSGWHHSVENLEDTLSINHNWINGFNIAWSVRLLCTTFQQAVGLLSDCRCALSAAVACCIHSFAPQDRCWGDECCACEVNISRYPGNATECGMPKTWRYYGISVHAAVATSTNLEKVTACQRLICRSADQESRPQTQSCC